MSHPDRKPVHIRVPFSLEQDLGLGDLLKRASSSVGIRPCGDCQHRAERLNQMLVFSGRSPQNQRHGYPDE